MQEERANRSQTVEEGEGERGEELKEMAGEVMKAKRCGLAIHLVTPGSPNGVPWEWPVLPAAAAQPGAGVRPACAPPASTSNIPSSPLINRKVYPWNGKECEMKI